MALHISKFYPYWAKGESTGYNTNFEDIICTPQTSNASTTTFTGDINGSDNWYYICRIDPDGVANAAENYSAFDWVNRYNTTYSAQLGGANIAWYMPSIQELCQVYKNREAINESLAKIHGLENGGSYADLSLGNNDFWSSSQSSAKSIYNTAIYAWRLHSHGLIDDVSKYSNAKVCCVADF